MEILNFRTSEQIDLLFAAMNAAQKIMGGARKDTVNPHFNRTYADLASVWEAGRDPLAENGLTVIQVPSASGGSVTVATMLGHKSGQWIAGELTLTPDKNTPQGAGSAITYARRYALSAFLGIAPEDDDGNEAEGRNAGRKKQHEETPRKTPDANPTVPIDQKLLDGREVVAGMAGEIGDVMFRMVMGQFDVASAAEIDTVQKARAVYKELTKMRGVVVAARDHGEVAKGVDELLFRSLPADAMAKVFTQARNKLVEACGQEVAREEYERTRKASKSQWEHYQELDKLLEKYVTGVSA